MGNQHIDGAINFGITPSLTIGAVTYIVEDFSPTDPSGGVDSYDQNGSVKGAAYWDEKKTGSMTLQFPAASTTAPAKFDTFSYDGENWLITEVGKTYQFQGEKKCTISIAQRFGSVTPPPE